MNANTKTFTVELTEAQGQSLLDMLDLAAKAGGLKVARHVLGLHDILQAAHQKSQDTSLTSGPKELTP